MFYKRIKLFYVFILVLLLPVIVQAQMKEITLQLSEKHVQKVNKQSNARKKLKLYRKYYHKDSLKHVRRLEKYWEKQSDSLHNVLYGTEAKIRKRTQHLSEKMDKKIPGAVSNKGKEVLNEKGKELDLYDANTGINDVGGELAQKISDNNLVNNGNEISEEIQSYGNQINEYSEYTKLLNSTDSLKAIGKQHATDFVEQHATELVNIKEVQAMKSQTAEMDKLKGMAGDYKNQTGQLGDSTCIKEQAKKKAEELAMKYISEHPEIMEGVQAKMNLLMKKYSVVPNSNDLSSAIKRTSLKGRAFRERLVVAANFQAITLDPVSIDFAPTIGYRFNKRFTAGLGLTYRQKFSADSIPRLSPYVWGYKTFVSYDVLKKFFAYGVRPKFTRYKTCREWF